MKPKSTSLLVFLLGCVLFTTPNTANVKADACGEHPVPVITATVKDAVSSEDEKDIDFNPLSTILTGYNILFN